MTFTELLILTAPHNIRIEALTNPPGLLLHGPRGSQKYLAVSANDTVDGFTVRLWLDGVAYSTAKALENRVARLGRKTAKRQHPAIKRVTFTPETPA